MCQFLSAIGADDLVPIADLRDGTPVFENSHIGGLAELMVTFEEWVVPIFTKATGRRCRHGAAAASAWPGSARRPRTRSRRSSPRSSVAVVGCGPLGLSAVQGARIAGASTIIAIDPIRVAPRAGAQSRRDARARSERRRRRARRARARADDVADRSALVRRAQSGRPPAGRRAPTS